MAVPYKEWRLFQKATLVAYGPTGWTDPEDWNTTRWIRGMKVGDNNTGATNVWHWRGIFRPWVNQDFESQDGMDEAVSIEMNLLFIKRADTVAGGMTDFDVVAGPLSDPNEWVWRTVSGRYYDGENQWDDYPNVQRHTYSYPNIVVADLPKSYTVWVHAVKNNSAWVNNYQDTFFRNGIAMYLSNYDPGVGAVEEFAASCRPLSMKVRYLNPVVNSISVDGEATRYWMSVAGGVEVILTGLGFSNSDAELDSPGLTLPGGWDDAVDEIYFVPLTGQTVPAVLKQSDGDFTVDSNTQVTIPADKMPALEEGSYSIKLVKKNVNLTAPTDIEGYAGDWVCASDGKASQGRRFTFSALTRMPVSDVRQKRGTILLMQCDKKARAGGAITTENWSLDDVRSPLRFYEGIITSVSSFRRGLDDRTGMFKMADLTVTLANYKKKFSKLLATHVFKNQIAKLYVAFLDEPEAWKAHVVSMVVEDYGLRGTSFEMELKDLSQKYFEKELPLRICEEDEEEDDFSNIHPDYIGTPMPEILGEAVLIEGENKGAIEAVCVDTVSFKYLAAARPLYSITKVYSDNVEMTEGAANDYVVTYGDNYTYIDFKLTQADKRITFNCTGYQYGSWDSSNGYVQNPAYILGYFLIEFLNVPPVYVDLVSVETLAAQYTAMGEELSGKLLVQEQNSAAEYFRQLLFSFGAKCWVSKEGRFKVGRKSLDDFDTDVLVFEQHDILAPIDRPMGLTKAVNVAEIYWDYSPAHNIFKGAKTDEKETLIDRYGERARDRIARRPRRGRRGEGGG